MINIYTSGHTLTVHGRRGKNTCSKNVGQHNMHSFYIQISEAILPLNTKLILKTKDIKHYCHFQNND